MSMVHCTVSPSRNYPAPKEKKKYVQVPTYLSTYVGSYLKSHPRQILSTRFVSFHLYTWPHRVLADAD